MTQFHPVAAAGGGVAFGRVPGVQGIDPVAIGADAAEIVGPRQQGFPVGIDVGRDLDGHPGGHAPPVLDEFQVVFQCRRLRHRTESRSLIGDEILEDDLLKMTMAGVERGQRVERAQPGLPRLAQAHQNATGVRHPGAARGLDRAQATLGRLLGRDRAVEGIVDVLEHEAHRGVHFGQTLEITRRHGTDVGVGQESGLQRSLTRPAHVGDEVVEAPRLQRGPQMRHRIGSLAGQEQDLRGSAFPGRGQEFFEARLGHEPLPIAPVPAVGAVPRAIPSERNRQRRRKRDEPRRIQEAHATPAFPPCNRTKPHKGHRFVPWVILGSPGTAGCACTAIQASWIGLARRAGRAPAALSEKAPYLLEVGWVELEGSDSGTHGPDKPSDSV